MGWTETSAMHFTKSGQINRKAECDGYFLEGLNHNYYKVVKSAMQGSVYYGAIMPLRRPQKASDGTFIEDGHGNYLYEDIPENEREVLGVVILTYVRKKTNFGYKIIHETMGPCARNCPASVLNALTPTTNTYALQWRKDCLSNLLKPSISKLPVGTEIQFIKNGKTITLRKSAPKYQFKRTFWINDSDFTYMSKKRIPKDFTIVSMP